MGRQRLVHGVRTLGVNVYRRAGPAAGDDDLVVGFAEGDGVGRGFEEDGVGEDLGTGVLVFHCAWAWSLLSTRDVLASVRLMRRSTSAAPERIRLARNQNIMKMRERIM